MKRWETVILILSSLILAGCPKKGAGGGGDGGFRVFYPDASARGITAKVGTRMQAKPAADCRNPEGAEGRWANTGARVVEGELPPGLVIEDGAIAGSPEKPGTYKVTIKFSGVTCASVPVDDQLVDVTIAVAGN